MRNDNFKTDLSYLKYQNYDIGELIGKGAYAEVRIGRHIPTGQKVAIKIYEKRKLLGLRRNLKREVKLLRSINHENIIKLYAYFSHGKHIYLIMEYGGQVSLCQYLKYSRYRKIPE